MLKDGETPRIYSRAELAERNANKHWLEKAAETVFGSILWLVIMGGSFLMVLFSIVSCSSSLQ